MAEDLQDLIDSIQGRMETEQEVLGALMKQVKLHQNRVKRLKGALRELQQDTQVKAQKRVRKDAPKVAPSAQMIQAILTVITEADEPLPIKEIEKRAGRSHSGTDNTIRYLRANEMIRLAGKRGTAFVYGPWKDNSTALKEAANGVAQLDAV